jgi:hypothetical protein
MITPLPGSVNVLPELPQATSFHTSSVDLIEGCSRDHKIPQTL